MTDLGQQKREKEGEERRHPWWPDQPLLAGQGVVRLELNMGQQGSDLLTDSIDSRENLGNVCRDKTAQCGLWRGSATYLMSGQTSTWTLFVININFSNDSILYTEKHLSLKRLSKLSIWCFTKTKWTKCFLSSVSLRSEACVLMALISGEFWQETRDQLIYCRLPQLTMAFPIFWKLHLYDKNKTKKSKR